MVIMSFAVSRELERPSRDISTEKPRRNANPRTAPRPGKLSSARAHLRPRRLPRPKLPSGRRKPEEFALELKTRRRSGIYGL
ncbi:hypothetical protein PF010_g7605 [Phytophthora fragariae]|uniref:Uncharacterized protein n=1 Tax=Phytophthora fragariae TaxID=53985 RepID=A0A6G0LH88_9STRA|nr:hypothetical protein PF010_g7605 [Phytophthora fragariae]